MDHVRKTLGYESRRCKMLFCAVAFALFGIFVQGALAQSSITMSPSSQYLIEEYRAYIGPSDIYNSNGVRLTRPWQVIRQDRANFHSLGRADRHDEWDSFFADVRNREQLEAMLRSGSISASASRAIVNGGVFIRVQIYGQGSTGRSVSVQVD